MVQHNHESVSTKSVQDYLRIAQRRRWWIVLPAFCVWLLVWGVSWIIPSTYRSETLIMVEPQKIPEQYVVSNVQDIQKRLESLAQQFESRSRLLNVIRTLQLYPEAKDPKAEEQMVEQFRRNMKVELVQTGRQTDVNGFKVSYTASNPQMAQKIVDVLTQSFMKDNLEARTQSSVDTTEFLDKQLATMRQKLAAQEENIRVFKNAHVGQLPAQLTSNLQILQGLQTRLAGLNESLNTAKQQGLYLESLLAQYKSIQTAVRKSGGSPDLPAQLDRELAKQKADLADLSSRYTDAHPDVVKLKQQIAATERAKKQLAAQGSIAQQQHDATPSTTELEPNSPIIQVESQLKANKLEVAQRERDIARLSAEIGSYQAKIDQIPVREEQLSEITRDYEQTTKEYDSLLAKRNQSELATDLVQHQQAEQFRVLDPPSLPVSPSFPNRLKFCLAGMAAGLAVGLVIAGGKEIHDDYLLSEAELSTMTSAPVLVTIPTIWIEEETIAIGKTRKLEYAYAACLLCVLLSGLAYTYFRA
jgi:polysaccharide biosynthesis transport protein